MADTTHGALTRAHLANMERKLKKLPKGSLRHRRLSEEIQAYAEAHRLNRKRRIR